MATILITTPSISFHDAVSNDTWQLEKFLKSKGHRVSVYAEHSPKKLESKLLTYEKASLLVLSPDVVWIYQHSVYWQLGDVLFNISKCRRILRYHNITPTEFFANYGDKIAAYATEQGTTQTRKIVRSGCVDRYINASRFNSEELIQMDARPDLMFEVAPLHKIDEFKDAQLSERITQSIDSNITNILFVGRFAPNKGFTHLLRVLDRYIALFGAQVRLHLAGNFGMVPPLYLKELKSIVRELRLGSHIKIWPSVNLNELFSLYKKCSCLLVTSEHEGFCVPLIEAQFNQLPIVALDRTAIAETLGPDQLCFKELDYDKLAAAVHYVTSDKEARHYIVEKGSINQSRFELAKLEQKFIECLQL